MLNKERLHEELKDAFEGILPNALEQGFKAVQPRQTKNGDKMAKRFAEVVVELSADQLAKSIATAIDYYIKNACIYGTIITVGSPTTQTARVNSNPVITNGKIPNTLGIK